MNITGIMNRKGGVGKSTTAVNFAASAAQYGIPTLLIDLDPQGSATLLSGADKSQQGAGLLFDDAHTPVDELIVQTDWGYDLIPAGEDLSAADEIIRNAPLGELRLGRRLRRWDGPYRLCIIDTAGSAGRIYTAVAIACHDIISPLNASILSTNEVPDLLDAIDVISASRDYEPLKLRGLFLNRFDERTQASKIARQQLDEYLDTVSGVGLCKSAVLNTTEFEKAALLSMPATHCPESRRAGQAFKAVFAELYGDYTEVSNVA